jgi:hypothetical protein
MAREADSQVLRIVAEQRRRCVASLLGGVEAAEWWPKLTKDEQLDFRDDTIRAIGVLYDLCRDVIRATADDDPGRNGYVVEMLEAIHSRVVTPARSG